MVLESGHLESSRPSAWTELGPSWCCLLSSPHSWPQGRGGTLNTGFYSAECSSDLVGRQFGALLEACFISKETEVGSSVHSQSSEQVALRQALRSAPLGRAARLLEESARWWEAYRRCWESDFHMRNWRSLRKILRKLRSCGPSRASPRHCLFSPRSFTSVPLETGTSNTFLEGKLLTLLRWFANLYWVLTLSGRCAGCLTYCPPFDLQSGEEFGRRSQSDLGWSSDSVFTSRQT